MAPSGMNDRVTQCMYLNLSCWETDFDTLPYVIERLPLIPYLPPPPSFLCSL